MKFYTPTPEKYSKGSCIVVESKPEVGNDKIFIGKVKSISDNYIKTYIPLDEKAEAWNFVKTKARIDIWTSRFEKTGYKRYMKAEINNSGNISITGE